MLVVGSWMDLILKRITSENVRPPLSVNLLLQQIELLNRTQYRVMSFYTLFSHLSSNISDPEPIWLLEVSRKHLSLKLFL